MSSQKDNRQANLTRGIRVEIASLVYNIIEVVVSVTVGLLTGSAALVSWGLDSTVEATSAATLIWRLKGEKDGAGKRTVLVHRQYCREAARHRSLGSPPASGCGRRHDPDGFGDDDRAVERTGLLAAGHLPCPCADRVNRCDCTRNISSLG